MKADTSSQNCHLLQIAMYSFMVLLVICVVTLHVKQTAIEYSQQGVVYARLFPQDIAQKFPFDEKQVTKSMSTPRVSRERQHSKNQLNCSLNNQEKFLGLLLALKGQVNHALAACVKKSKTVV